MLSSQLPGFHTASKASRMLMLPPSKIAQVASSTVAGKVRIRSLATGCAVIREIPISPCAGDQDNGRTAPALTGRALNRGAPGHTWLRWRDRLRPATSGRSAPDEKE